MLAWVWITSFIITQTFQQLLDLLGSHVVFWIYGVVAGTGILVTLIMLPETKGKPFERILAFYSNEKKRKMYVAAE